MTSPMPSDRDQGAAGICPGGNPFNKARIVGFSPSMPHLARIGRPSALPAALFAASISVTAMGRLGRWSPRREAASSAARSGSSGPARVLKGRKTCRSDSIVAMSLPTSRLPCTVTMEMPPGTLIGIADRAIRHLGDDRAHLGVELVEMDPAEVTALQGGLALAELRRHHREGGTGPELGLITVSAKRAVSAAFVGSSIGRKISPTRYSVWPNLQPSTPAAGWQHRRR